MRQEKSFRSLSSVCHSRLSGILPKKDSGYPTVGWTEPANIGHKQAGVTKRIFGSSQLIALIISVVMLITLYSSLVTASEKWSGVDESVIEKYAKEHGREAKEPLINTDQGDLLLFVFLLAGTVGGFAAGYYWKTLINLRTKGDGSKNKEKKEGDAALL